MSWLSRSNFQPSDRLHAQDLNNLALDQQTWGGDVNGGGHVLSNVVLVGVSQHGVNDVLSVFGRVGSVVATAGDYTVAQVTGALASSRQVLAGPGLVGGGALTSDVTLSALVTSVFGRSGAVTLTPADVTAVGGVLNSRSISTGAGLTGGGNLSADRTIAVVPDSVDQRIQVLSGGSLIATRHAVNFISGANINIAVTDNQLANRLDIAVSASGGGSPTIDPTTTLGDLIVRSATPALARLGVGLDGQVLTADSTQPVSIKWANPPVNAITSVFGRTGAIVAAAGDYTAALVTNAVDASQAYANPAWLTSLVWSKVTNAPAFMTDPMTAKGDLIVHAATTTRLPVAADGMFLMTDSTQAPGLRWATVATYSQTPWTGDHDAANFSLRNAKALGVGGAAGANNPLAVLSLSSADAGSMEVSSVLFADPVSRLQFGCSSAYAGTGAPWLQGYLATGGVCPVVLQPAGSSVGIGQAQPAFALDIVGDCNVSGNFRVGGIIFAVSQTPWTTDQDADSHILSNAGGIGIGTVASGSTLRVASPGAAVLLENPDQTGVSTIQFNLGGVYQWELGAGLPLEGEFYVRDMNGLLAIQIDSVGNIGMGHPPLYALDVAGDVNCTGVFRILGVEIGTVSSVFGRTGAVDAMTGDYAAAQVTGAVDQTVGYSNPSWITALAWSKITGAPPVGVSTVFGRGGAILAATGDYTVAQVTGAVATTRTISTGTGLTGGGNLSQDRILSVVPDSVNQQVLVLSSGVVAGMRHAINFIAGANVALSIADDTVNNRVNMTVSSTGGAGGMVDPTTTVGDLIVRGTASVSRLGIGANGQVLVADSAQVLGMHWATPVGASGSQTPWLTDIDAANFNLTNVAFLGVGGGLNAWARINITVAGLEEGLNATSHVAANPASISVTNDITDYLRIRSYGSAYAIDPGMAALEASMALKLVANTNEVMRLTAGHVLIGTTVDDAANMLQVNGTVKSGAGGFVFPDGTTQTTAAGVTTNLVTSVFTRTGAVAAQAGDYTAAQVTNAVSTLGAYANPAWITSLAWSKITGAPAAAVTSVFSRTGVVVAVAGDYTAAQVTNAVSTAIGYADPAWITSLAWSKITGTPVFSQTPWVSDVDAASYNLNNTAGIGIRSGAVAQNGVTCTSSQIRDIVYQLQPSAANYAGFQLNNDLGHKFFFRLNGSAVVGASDFAALMMTGCDLAFVANGTEAMRIKNSNGYVGIGTSNPQSRFVVSDVGGGTGLEIKPGWAITDFNGVYLMAYDRVNSVPRDILIDQAGSFTTFKSGGAVGIGNLTLPAFAGTYTTLFVGPQAASAVNGQIVLCGYTASTTVGGGGNLNFANYAITGPDKRIALIGSGVDGAIDSGHLDFMTWAAGVPNARMTIRANGHVGIGTTVPANQFVVSNAGASGLEISVAAVTVGSATGAYLISYDRTAGVNQDICIDQGSGCYTTFKAGGNVGIGATTNPRGILDVIGANAIFQFRPTQSAIVAGSTNGGAIYFGLDQASLYSPTAAIETSWGAGGNPCIGIGVTRDGLKANILMDYSGYTHIRSGVTELMTIQSNGYVGIGVTNPTHPLEVQSGLLTAAVFQSTSAGAIGFGGYSACGFVQGYTDRSTSAIANLFLQPSGGWVGIGVVPKGIFQARVAVDQNIGMHQINGLATLQFYNDAGNTFVPAQYYASYHYFMGGLVSIGSQDPPSHQLVIRHAGASGLEIEGDAALGGGRGPYIVAYDRTAAVYRDLLIDHGGQFSIFSAGGLVGIGAYPTQKLDVVAPSYVSGMFSGGSGGGALGIGGQSGVGMIQGFADRTGAGGLAHIMMQPTGQGFVGISCIPSYLFHVSADSAAKPGTSTWTVPSDERTKESREPLQGGVEVINKLTLEVARYNGAAGTPKGGRVVSVSAQQAQLVMPQSVNTYKTKLWPDDSVETEMLGWNAHELFMQAVLAIQQLDARLKALEGAQTPKENIQ